MIQYIFLFGCWHWHLTNCRFHPKNFLPRRKFLWLGPSCLTDIDKYHVICFCFWSQIFAVCNVFFLSILYLFIWKFKWWIKSIFDIICIVLWSQNLMKIMIMVLSFKKIVVSPIKRTIVRIYIFQNNNGLKNRWNAENWKVYIFICLLKNIIIKILLPEERSTNLIRKLAWKYNCLNPTIIGRFFQFLVCLKSQLICQNS